MPKRTVQKHPFRLKDGPWGGHTIWLSGPSTAVIRVGKFLGRYTSPKDPYAQTNGDTLVWEDK